MGLDSQKQQWQLRPGEVTAAKETTRKMTMALTQRRKSWGLGAQGQEKQRAGAASAWKFSRLVSGLTLRYWESPHGDILGHNIRCLRDRKQERELTQLPRGGTMDAEGQEPRLEAKGLGWGWTCIRKQSEGWGQSHIRLQDMGAGFLFTQEKERLEAGKFNVERRAQNGGGGSTGWGPSPDRASSADREALVVLGGIEEEEG